jgi:hypothetical protein
MPDSILLNLLFGNAEVLHRARAKLIEKLLRKLRAITSLNAFDEGASSAIWQA